LAGLGHTFGKTMIVTNVWPELEVLITQWSAIQTPRLYYAVEISSVGAFKFQLDRIPAKWYNK
jgi:hypothetical protein